MAFFDFLRGYRWSVYVVHDGILRYSMDSNSVIKASSYFLVYFAHNRRPVSPWSVHLNFNLKHVSFELLEKHVEVSGPSSYVNFSHSAELINKIKNIDPGFMVMARDEPLFIDIKTKKEIPIRTNHHPYDVVHGNVDPDTEITFYSVMDKVFSAKD